MPAKPIPAVALAVLAIAAAGCGEKQEPDLSQVPPPPQPPAPNPPPGLPAAVKGLWAGTLSQKGVKPFPIRVRIVSAAEPKRNVVHYGGQIDCSGRWAYAGASGPTVRFRETIDRGSGGRCKGSGEVGVTPGSRGMLRYEFRGGGVHSTGVLRHR